MPRQGVPASQLGSARTRGGWLPSHLQQKRAGGAAEGGDGGHPTCRHGAQRGVSQRQRSIRALSAHHSPKPPLDRGLISRKRVSQRRKQFSAMGERPHQRPRPSPPHSTLPGCEGRERAHRPAAPGGRRAPPRRERHRPSPGGARGLPPLPLPLRPARPPPRMPAGPGPSSRAWLGNAAGRREQRRKVAGRQGGASRERAGGEPAPLPPAGARTHRLSGACGRGPPPLSALSFELRQLQQEGSW